MTPPLFMVFDVESIGLHGEGFAVGYVVVDQDGKELMADVLACSPERAVGTAENYAWIQANVPALRWNCARPAIVRERFWRAWLSWKDHGALLAADVAWPVEARFLATCVDEDCVLRAEEGPYPLIDIASVRFVADVAGVRFATGFDPLALDDRRENELPQHDPLADARQSARLLVEALRALKGAPV